MSTKSTLAHHDSADGNPSWHLYEEAFEAGVVYLELEGVNVDLYTREQGGGVDVVLRLPVATAQQLGLLSNAQPGRWKSACDAEKNVSIKALMGVVPKPDQPVSIEDMNPASGRLRGSVRRYDNPTEPVWPSDDEPS